jgi:hypothetical protein
LNCFGHDGSYQIRIAPIGLGLAMLVRDEASNDAAFYFMQCSNGYMNCEIKELGSRFKLAGSFLMIPISDEVSGCIDGKNQWWYNGFSKFY